MEQLTLIGCSIGDKRARELCEALKTNKTLTRLALTGEWYNEKDEEKVKNRTDWTGNVIEAEGARMIRQAVRKNPSFNLVLLTSKDNEQ